MTALHPCAGRSAASVAAFEAVATGDALGCTPRTIKGLLDAGLIEQVGVRQVGRDALGAICAPVYEVPLPIHMQWCEWCAENVPDDADTRAAGSGPKE